jgi:hypothetical protein
MTARFDTDIRDALADILDTAPAIPTTPPSDVDLVATETAGSPTRWLAAAAAIVVVVAGLGWISQRPRDVQPIASEPTVTPYLAELAMLPTAMPDGWQLVDVNVVPPGEGTQQRGNIVALAEIRGGARAVISLDPSGVPADPELPPRELAAWNSSQRALTWSDDGQRVILATLGLDETEARTLAASLIPIGPTTAGRSYTVPPASGFTVEHQYLVDGQTFPETGSTQLIVTDAEGTASSIVITPRIPVPDITMLLYAPQPPTATVEVASTTGVAALVRLVAGSIISTDSETGTISPELRAIFDSIEPADAALWASTRTAISDTIAAAPVIAQGDALDVTVSLHTNGAVSGLCITRGDQTGCDWTAKMSAAGQFAPTLVGATGSILLSDGSWSAVHVSPDGSTCPLNVEAEQASVTIAGQVIAVIQPTATATEVSCVVDSQGDTPKEYFTATRPI